MLQPFTSTQEKPLNTESNKEQSFFACWKTHAQLYFLGMLRVCMYTFMYNPEGFILPFYHGLAKHKDMFQLLCLVLWGCLTVIPEDGVCSETFDRSRLVEVL